MSDEPLSDLGLAVLLLNSVDLLEDPADRMASDPVWWRRALGRHGHADLARTQRNADLPMLHALRATIRTVFECDDAEDARRVLNLALLYADAVVQVEPDGLAVSGGLRGRLLFAVAEHVATHGVARLGICASDPCRCAYVDTTRAGTRRYCCTLCNDRAAARAYRRRKGETGS
ncbi:MAG TPA: CGNR zinc finger domain-containing protein [Nocardioides sp.]|uniref:CGNR zinc finger domain-containing protein n=1 Tax=Nocardioides sp. TaxID=35761 RepID=UPI002E30AADB|nr:CGNR zinc finger domain-containing protein [Nocardioides sp.]HEX5086722.1 CGNR zinc finger domain-containing protein [Nocardioides sp.]